MMIPKVVPLLGPQFDTQTPEQFHAYAKSLNKPWKKPEVKPKTKKKSKKNDNDINAGLNANSPEKESAKKDVGNVEIAGRSDLGGDKLFELIAD